MKTTATSITAYVKWFLTLCVWCGFMASLSRATTVIPPQFDELVNESDFIVRGVVKSVKSEWRENQGRRYILTYVEVNIQEVISGAPPSPLVLEILGGRVGEEAMVVDGVPKFEVGQEDILFVRGNGHQFCPLTALMHGRYPVVREKNGRAHISRSNHVPLHETAEVAQPLEDSLLTQKASVQTSTSGMELETFVQQIRSAKNVNYHRSARTAR